MKNRTISIFLSLMLLFPTLVMAGSQSDFAIDVVLNGKVVQFSPGALSFNGNTMVPFRELFETYGATVNWDSKTQTVTAVKDTKKIILTLDSNVAYLNDKEYKLIQSPFLIDNHMLVNLRFISESLGAQVSYNKEPKPTVYISWNQS
jgi:hypothetical protein